MRRKLPLLIIGLTLLASLLLAGAFLLTRDDGVQDVTTPNGTAPQAKVETVTKVGTIGCLEHKDTSGPQITSCAIGIKQDDGISYALNSDDPSTTGSIPTGTRVQVTGTLTEQSTQYDSAGVIHVTSFKKL